MKAAVQLDLLPRPTPAFRVELEHRVPIVRGRNDPYEPFDVEGCLEIVSELGATGQWMDDHEVFSASVMRPQEVSAFLHRLASLGVIESQARCWCRNRLVAPDGYVVGVGHPEVSVMMRENTYQGFYNAYRLREPAQRIEE